jgi:hypothetical protein
MEAGQAFENISPERLTPITSGCVANRPFIFELAICGLVYLLYCLVFAVSIPAVDQNLYLGTYLFLDKVPVRFSTAR